MRSANMATSNVLIVVWFMVSISSANRNVSSATKRINTDNLESLDAELLALDEEFSGHYAKRFYEIIHEADKLSDGRISLALYSMAWNHLKYALNNYVVQRRMIVGLKVNFARQFQKSNVYHLKSLLARSQLPVVPSSRVNLRSNFPGISDDELANVITLIEVRARFRTQDDVVALGATNIKKIIQMVESHAFDRSQIYSANVADWGLILLKDYYQNVLEYQILLSAISDQTLDDLNYSTEINDGGKTCNDDELILSKVDGIINDALDIQLSIAAQALEVPPTINEDMINNLVEAWLPEDIVKDQQRVLDVLVEAGLESRDSKKRGELAGRLDSIQMDPDAALDLIARLGVKKSDENGDIQE